jgi:hypothetical protein
MMKRKMLLFAVISVVLSVIHYSQKASDRVRFSIEHQEDRFFLPDPTVMKVVSLGNGTLVGDILWIRTVLIFADFAWTCNQTQAQWLLSMIRSIAMLDPQWRTIYFYGGTMMSVCSATKEADEIFLLGHTNLPNDYFFPFSLAMNAYLEHKDYQSAQKWMEIAANLPDAPSWYKAAVAGVIDQQGQREASIQYLQDEISKTPADSPIKSSLEERLRLLLHEKYSAMLQQTKEKLEIGKVSVTMQEVLATYTEIPEDPWHEGWIIASDGVIRSLEMERRESKRMRLRERQMLKQ